MKNKRKFFLQMIIVVLPVFILFNWIYYIQVHENYVQTLYEIGDNITDQSRRALLHWIEYQVNIARTIAGNDYVIDACRNPEDEMKIEKATAFMEEIHALYPFYENLPLGVRLEQPVYRMINGERIEISNGEFITDTMNGQTVGEGGLEYAYIEEIFNGKDYYVSEIYPSILRGNPILVISVPVIDRSEIIGVALVSPQMEAFTREFIDNIAFKDTGYLFLSDDRNITIAHPNREVILSEDSRCLEINAAIIEKYNQGINFFNDTLFNERKFYFVKSVDIPEGNAENKWFITFAESQKEVLRPFYHYLFINIATSIVMVVIIIFLVVLVVGVNHREQKREVLEKMNDELEKKVEERTKALKRMTMIDGLTQIYNYKTAHRLLKQIIEESAETKSPFVLIIADLDYFKKINDTHGHLMGNEVLVAASKLIASDVRSSDVVGRYGGEEFIVILRDISIEGGYRRAESIRRKIEEENFSIEGVKVTISMGICEWRGESVQELIKKADKALYQAKSNGRNRVEKVG